MPRHISSFLTFALLATACFLAEGQKFQPKSIQFKGGPDYSDQELMDAAGLKKGVVLTSAEMNDHSKKLMDSGVIDNLTYKFDGVDLVYTLIPPRGSFPFILRTCHSPRALSSMPSCTPSFRSTTARCPRRELCCKA